MAPRKPPEAWYWSYDIKPEDIDAILVPGARLVRLSSYRKGASPRFAAIAYKEAGPPRRHAHDLEPAAAVARLAETGERPISVTVAAADGAPRLSLLTESGPGPVSALHVDLDEDALRALLDGEHAIGDLATYTTTAGRRYAAILIERQAQALLFTGVTAQALDAKLVEHGAALVRVRPYLEGGKQLFAAVAERGAAATWSWYASIDPDAVARHLENNQSYPYDLEATRDDAGLRFTVIMYRST